jgi:N-acyl-D-amino-acid deacylase
MKLDLLILDGSVVDPEKLEIYKANIGVEGDSIVYVGSEAPTDAKVTIDAKGLYVSPGFIDTHVHDEKLDEDDVERALLLQGVTTAVAGNCGLGPILSDELLSKPRYLRIGFFTGHQTLRQEVGLNDVYMPADSKAIKEMVEILKQELSKGSFGLSLGLEYVPGASYSEISELAKVVAQYDKKWVSIHIRYDGERSLEGVKEAISLASECGVRVQISHLASMASFGCLEKALEMIEEAKPHADITFDSYPYRAFCTRIGSAVFDPGFEKRWKKGFSSLQVASGKNRGKRLTQELYVKLRKEEPDTLIIAHVMNEEEVKVALKHPDCMIASDALTENGQGHPRVCGTFPRAFRILLKEGLSWPEIVRKATYLPAKASWFEDRGVIKQGCKADLVVFHPKKIEDCATFKEPNLPPKGIEHVVLGGKIAAQKGVPFEPEGEMMLRR